MAKSGLTGLDKLKKINKAIVAITKIPSRVAKSAVEGVEEAIEAQFNTGCDPFGKPWAPLKPSTIKKGRTPPPLTDTGELRDVTVTASAGAGISVEFGRPDVAEKHQNGKDNLPVRQLWPKNAAQLKKSSWGKAIVQAYAVAVVDTPELRDAGATMPSASSLTSAAE